MKNQYVGDFNDFCKYAFLRFLTDGGRKKLGIHWMLTPDDNRSDGRKTSYLTNPDKWRHIDPELFDALAKCVNQPERKNIDSMIECSIFGSALHWMEIQNENSNRNQTHKRFLQASADCDLIFYDPDNGIFPKSVSPGSKEGGKFVHFNETRSALDVVESVIVYQHFRRNKGESREQFINLLLNQSVIQTGALCALAWRTPNTFFLVLSKNSEFKTLRELQLFANQWPKEFLFVHQDDKIETPTQDLVSETSADYGHLRSYKELRVWKAAFQLALDVYEVTFSLPVYEKFGLTAQMRRSATSIPSNIAEGYCRNHRNEYLQFLGIARGSLGELETQVLLTKAIYENLEVSKLLDSIEQTGKQLLQLIRNLKPD